MLEPTSSHISVAQPSESVLSLDTLPLAHEGERTSGVSSASTTAIAPVAFPGFEILGELGRGGMGVVYRARQLNLNRLVALKVLLGGPFASREDKARFRVEAEAAARLQHPNIVQVYNVGEHVGFAYIALELIEGPTLSQWQNGAKIEPTHAASLAATIARAIQHAHEQGIVHRDIKPANILIADCGLRIADFKTGNADSAVRHPQLLVPKITDFGLAKPLNSASSLTQTGAACGTPNYMAPEQVRGKELSPSVDVYALGAVLYELLTGRPPFVGTDAPDVMNQILLNDAPPVQKFAPKVPRDLAVIVTKCLEKDPTRRYAAAGAVAEDLERFLSGQPISARSISPVARAGRWVKRNPIVAAFLFASTLGCLLTGSLAVALAQSEADAHRAREEAEKQRHEAEVARDELKAALTHPACGQR